MSAAETRVEKLYFVVTGEFMTQHARDLVYEDAGGYARALRFLTQSLVSMDEPTARRVLAGSAKLTGDSTTGLDLEPDDQEEQMRAVRREVGLREARARFRRILPRSEYPEPSAADSAAGWILRNGTFYGCRSWEHGDLAGRLQVAIHGRFVSDPLGKADWEGWLKVSPTAPHGACAKRLSSAQRAAFLDWRARHKHLEPIVLLEELDFERAARAR